MGALTATFEPTAKPSALNSRRLSYCPLAGLSYLAPLSSLGAPKLADRAPMGALTATFEPTAKPSALNSRRLSYCPLAGLSSQRNSNYKAVVLSERRHRRVKTKRLDSNHNNIRVRGFVLSGAPTNEINGSQDNLAALATVISGSLPDQIG
jgi:hypothetical protein